jgi:hypothetical protein
MAVRRAAAAHHFARAVLALRAARSDKDGREQPITFVPGPLTQSLRNRRRFGTLQRCGGLCRDATLLRRVARQESI